MTLAQNAASVGWVVAVPSLERTPVDLFRSTVGDDHRLLSKIDPETSPYLAACLIGEVEDIIKGRAAVVHEHECVLLGKSGTSMTMSFEPALLEKPAGGNLDAAMDCSAWYFGNGSRDFLRHDRVMEE